MNTHSTVDPVEAFVAGLETTQRLRGVALYAGSSNKTRTERPNRIVFYPASADVVPRQKKPAGIDAHISVDAAIWGASSRHVWEIYRRLYWGWREWAQASDAAPLVEWGSLTWDTGEDGGQQGAPLTATLTLKGQPVEDVVDQTTGRIDEITYEDQS